MAGHRVGPAIARLLRRSGTPLDRGPRIYPTAAAIAGFLFVWLEPGHAESSTLRPIPIAIIDFEYSDSSGEVQDQTEKHRALVQAFMTSLRSDLSRADKFDVVTLSCGPQPCSSAHVDVPKLLGLARDAGAALLLYGNIHKMSTLVQWAKVQVVDVRADRLVLDRLLSFRGDDERAWQRAEAFLAADLGGSDLLDRHRADNASAVQREEQP